MFALPYVASVVCDVVSDVVPDIVTGVVMDQLTPAFCKQPHHATSEIRV